MNGSLKISDAMDVLEKFQKNGLDIEFSKEDMVLIIKCDVYDIYDKTVTYIPVSEQFDDLEDVIAFFKITCCNEKITDYFIALNDSEIIQWLHDYDSYMLELNRGVTYYYELAIEDGLESLLDILIYPNTPRDNIVDYMNYLTGDDPYRLWDQTAKNLISKLFAIREKHN